VSIAAPIFLCISLLGFWLAPRARNTTIPSADIQLCSGSEDPNQVIAACTRLLQAGGQNAADTGLDYKFRGIADNKERQFSAGNADLTQAIQRRPNDATAYDARSVSEGSQGDTQGVLNDSAAALKIAPNDQYALTNEARVYMQQGLYSQALGAANAAINLSPSDNTYSIRGEINLHANQFADSARDYNLALRNNPHDEQAMKNIGYDELQLGHYSATVADETAALKMNPNDTNAQTTLLAAQNKLGPR
jgi:tetratricopeptide (TPR) repeat protein